MSISETIAEINDEFKSELEKENNEYTKILNMTNEEAIELLAKLLYNSPISRGNGKSISALRMQMALAKAIYALKKGSEVAEIK